MRGSCSPAPHFYYSVVFCGKLLNYFLFRAKILWPVLEQKQMIRNSSDISVSSSCLCIQLPASLWVNSILYFLSNKKKSLRNFILKWKKKRIASSKKILIHRTLIFRAPYKHELCGLKVLTDTAPSDSCESIDCLFGPSEFPPRPLHMPCPNPAHGIWVAWGT